MGRIQRDTVCVYICRWAPKDQLLRVGSRVGSRVGG